MAGEGARSEVWSREELLHGLFVWGLYRLVQERSADIPTLSEEGETEQGRWLGWRSKF